MTVATIDVAARPSSQLQAAPAGNGSPAVLRVLMVDGLPLAAYGLHALVGATRGLIWCGATRSVVAALAAVREVRPHVVLVDSELDPDGRGIRALKNAHPRGLVIGLVRQDARDAAGYVRAARAARVNGLVSRSAAPGVLVAAIRAVCAGQTFVDPRLEPLMRSHASGGAQGAEQPSPLSGRQLEILALISRGLRNAEIARALFVSVETVRTHVKDILRRLSVRDRAHAVARGYQLGLLGRRTNGDFAGGVMKGDGHA